MTGADRTAAAIYNAATAAGAIDNDAAFAMIDRATLTFDSAGNPTNAPAVVAALKTARPHLFKPSVRDMSGPEYSAAKAGLFGDERARKRAATQARELERITKKYQK